MQPVFRADRIVGYTACTSHLVDLGGTGMGPEGSDIYDEGLCLPPLRLVTRGEVDQLVLDIVRANSREPIANEGDIYALIACCEAGARRLADMMDEFGIDDLGPLADHVVETSRRGQIAAIAEVPPGAYVHTLDVDGYETPLTLAACLTVSPTGMALDFTGTSGCSAKGINVPLNYATAYAVFALRCIVGAEIPNNAGSLAPFRVTGPPGCILNAQRPAPVAMRHTLGQMTPDLVFGCLHQALPGRVPAEGASAMYDLPLRSAPEVSRGGGRAFAIELTHNGGTGARPGADGLSATAFPSGVWGTQVEITEAAVPLLVNRRELIPDSGGPGRTRGGLGQRIELSAADDLAMSVFLSVERVRTPALGREGGHAGAAGRIRLRGAYGSLGADLPGKGEFRIEPGSTLVFETPGGGGYGPPEERSDAAVARDLAEGLVTEAGRQSYRAQGVAPE